MFLLVLAHLGSPGQRAVKRLCVCVCVCYIQAIANCISAAGYDVGEYSALVFAGAMSFEDGMFLFCQICFGCNA